MVTHLTRRDREMFFGILRTCYLQRGQTRNWTFRSLAWINQRFLVCTCLYFTGLGLPKTGVVPLDGDPFDFFWSLRDSTCLTIQATYIWPCCIIWCCFAGSLFWAWAGMRGASLCSNFCSEICSAKPSRDVARSRLLELHSHILEAKAAQRELTHSSEFFKVCRFISDFALEPAGWSIWRLLLKRCLSLREILRRTHDMHRCIKLLRRRSKRIKCIKSRFWMERPVQERKTIPSRCLHPLICFKTCIVLSFYTPHTHIYIYRLYI